MSACHVRQGRGEMARWRKGPQIVTRECSSLRVGCIAIATLSNGEDYHDKEAFLALQDQTWEFT